jgi:glycosyltransferase involved in cell wall biosynthesis
VRILQVAGSYPPEHCGIGDYAAQLAQALAGRPGQQVAVLTREVPGDRGGGSPQATPATGVERESTSATRPFQPRAQLLPPIPDWRPAQRDAIRQRVADWAPDVVHIHYPAQGFYGSTLAPALPGLLRRPGAIGIQTWHEPWPLRMLPAFLRQRAGADGVVIVRSDFHERTSRIVRALLRGLPLVLVRSAGSLPVSAATAGELAALRTTHLQGRSRLIVFFGFVHRAKGVHELFGIADPATDAVLIAGPIGDAAYGREIEATASQPPWQGAVRFTGFLTPEAAADLLAAADAVVLPFVAGAGDWNTSVDAALTQGTLVVTTAREPQGDDPARNLYTAAVGDVAGMRSALQRFAGRRVAPQSPAARWAQIADAHLAFYAHVRSIRTTP